MNKRQEVFWKQAKTDWEMYGDLIAGLKPVCHALHFLQMCTEKLAKAYFAVPPNRHDVFVGFIKALRTNKRAIIPLGFADDAELTRWAHSVDLVIQANKMFDAIHAIRRQIHENVKVTTDNSLRGLGGDPCSPGPILLQENGCPVQFRNIWIVAIKE